MSVSEKDFRKMMGRFTTGVAIITTHHHGKPVGVTINTLTSVSLDPPLVLFCLGQKRVALPAFLENTSYAIHILSSQQQGLCRAFANSSTHPSSSPWDGLAYDVTPQGCPLIPGSLGVLQCHREQTFSGGDHVIFLNQVKGIHWEESDATKAPLVYFQGTFR